MTWIETLNMDIYCGNLPNICWFQLLKCESLQLFVVIFDISFNIFELVVGNKAI